MITRRKGRSYHPPRRVTCTKPSYAATTWITEDVSMGKCQFAHGMKELIKYSLCVCLDHVEQRRQCTLLLFRGHFTTVLLTGMTALTEEEDISDAIMLKPLPLVVRRASQSASTNTSNNAPFTLSVDTLLLVVCPRAYLEDVTIR